MFAPNKDSIDTFNFVAKSMTKNQIHTAEKEFVIFLKTHKNILLNNMDVVSLPNNTRTS